MESNTFVIERNGKFFTILIFKSIRQKPISIRIYTSIYLSKIYQIFSAIADLIKIWNTQCIADLRLQTIRLIQHNS